MHRLRWIILWLLLPVFLPAPGKAATPNDATPELWFPVGETLDYRLYWGKIYVGYLHVSTEWVEEDGRRLLSITGRARSNAFLDKIWRVDDLYQSIVDPETFVPVRFIKRTREGRRESDEVTIFDHKRLVAKWEATRRKRGGKPKFKSKEYPIGPDTRDVVTQLYYARKFRFDVGEQRLFKVMTGAEIYDLYVNAEKAEVLKSPYFGKIDTIKFYPEAALEKVFVKKGKVWFWVSNDERWIVVSAMAAVTAPLPVKAKAILWKVGGPGGDRWVPAADGDYGDPDEAVGW